MADLEVEKPLLAKPRSAVCFVATGAEFTEMLATLRDTDEPVAIDAERAAGFRYSNRAYLIQLHSRGLPIFLIDPIAVLADYPEAFDRLQEVIEDREWIIHAATQDLPCLAELGLRPKRLFDTELAGRLAGLSRVGLGYACEALLSIRLAKEHSAVDWSTRPLKADWLTYAALDVDVLPDLRDAFEHLLAAQTKSIWAAQEFAHLTNFKPKQPDPERWRSMSGLHLVRDRVQLAVARELWKAREKLAIEKDVSPGRLLPDASMVHACKQNYHSIEALTSDSNFIGRASRVYKQVWWQAIEFGRAVQDPPTLATRQEGIPNHRSWPTKFPDADRRLKILRHFMTGHAEALQLPLENLLHPEIIRRIAWELSDADRGLLTSLLSETAARAWQTESCLEVLAEALKAAADPDFALPDPQVAS